MVKKKIRAGVVGGSMNNKWASQTHIPALLKHQNLVITALVLLAWRVREKVRRSNMFAKDILTDTRFAVKSTRLQQQNLKAKNLQNHDRCGVEGFLSCSQSTAYSHSIVAGGLEVTSYTIRLTFSTSLTIRTEIFSSTSQGMRAQSAVMPSMDVTARIPTV